MAVRGEFSWPSVGNSGGRPWGILMAACGEIAMAVDNPGDPRRGAASASGAHRA